MMKFFKDSTFVKKLIGIGTVLFGLVAVVSSSVAWFVASNMLSTDTMNASITTNYFHCGIGTQADPFVITRPKHWYNFAKLMETTSIDFYAEEYYFQIGYDLDDDGDLEVYNYNNDGTLNTGTLYSATLNCYSIGAIPPIGTNTHPFHGHLNGNGLTISNLYIDGTGRSDIGIFGYIDNVGTLSNIYFESPTISLYGSNPGETNGTTHTHSHDSQLYVGYLVGHLVYSSNVCDAYVNNCNIDSKNYTSSISSPTSGTTSSSSTSLTNYGYYGYVEYLGRAGGSGNTELDDGMLDQKIF